MTTLICLPAHILDADITPRAREVLMLLASQTSAAEPALWICQATIAQRLRCSVATVARSIHKLVKAKLIAETGKLHQGRYKFYHVRWSGAENLKAVEKKIAGPVRKVAPQFPLRKENPPASLRPGSVRLAPIFKGGEDRQARACIDEPLSPPPPTLPPAPTPISTLSPSPMLKDNRIAYYAEIARKQHEENRRRYKEILLSLSSSSGV